MKGQSAIEYLMTYGWMLLVVAVVGGAVFSIVGDQSIESVQGFDSNHVTVSDFGTTAASLQMVVEGGSQGITLKEITISDDGENVSISLDNSMDLGGSKTIDLPHITIKDETNEIDVELKYDAGGLENITSSGTIVGNIGLDDGLLGYWTLSENQANGTYAYDISGHENHGEILGAKFTASEERESVLNFNGDGDRVETGLQPTDLGISGNAARTIMASANIRSFDDDRGLWEIGTEEGGEEFSLRVQDTENLFRAQLWGGADIDFNYDAKDKWVDFVLLHNGEETEIYANGQFIASQTQKINTTDNKPFEIGYWNRYSRSLNGTMSDVKIYDRALSESEIQALHQNSNLIQ